MLGADKRGEAGEGSEVARILAQISAEYEAAQQGLIGLAYGASRHAFVTAKMENIGRLHNELEGIVGDNAIALVAEQFEKRANASNQPVDSSD